MGYILGIDGLFREEIGGRSCFLLPADDRLESSSFLIVYHCTILYHTPCEQDLRRVHPYAKEAHMKKHGKSIIALVVMVALIAGLSGCAKEGPMEKAGKKVDKAVEDIKK